MRIYSIVAKILNNLHGIFFHAIQQTILETERNHKYRASIAMAAIILFAIFMRIMSTIYMRMMSTMSNMCVMHMSTMANHVCHPQIFSLTLVLPEHRAGQPPQEFQLSAELLSISLVCQQRWNSLECFDGTYGWDGLLTMQLQYAICIDSSICSVL